MLESDQYISNWDRLGTKILSIILVYFSIIHPRNYEQHSKAGFLNHFCHYCLPKEAF